MQPKADNDNDQRPAEFDRHLVAAIPYLRRKVGLYAPPEMQEEIVQDALTAAVAKWSNFRNPYGDYRNFKTWMKWQLRLAARNLKDRNSTKKRYAATVDFDDVAYALSSEPQQENIAYANQVLRTLSRTREGRMLTRLGGEEYLREIGARHGICSQRVSQLVDKARTRLLKKVAA